MSSVGLVILAILGAPLFLIISASALVGFASIGRPAADVTGEISKLVQMDTLITIPLFTFAGYMLAESGAPRRLVAVTRALFGWAPGGMAVVTLLTCAFFTTFTGASGITIVALGGLLLPMLLRQGYERDFSLGLVATSGGRGLIFPPSLPVIIYGYIAAVDITRLYIAGIVPGVIGLAVVAFWCVRSGIVTGVPRTTFNVRTAAVATYRALPEVLLPVWLFALILTGVLKVPEAAAMTAIYVLIVEVLIYRDVHPVRDLPRITKESMVLCGAILVILAASLGLTNFLVQRGIPQAIVSAMSTVIPNKWAFLFALNILLLIVGCMMDIFSAIVIVVPLITPLAAKFGVHPIHLAIIFLVNLELGFSTPPVGMNLFIASFRFRQSILRLYRVSIPYLLMGIGVLLLVTYVPALSTFTVPEGEGTVQGGMVEHPGGQPGVEDKGGAVKPAAPVLDGICDEKLEGDPDCEEIELDEGEGDEGDEDAEGADAGAGGSAPAADGAAG